MHVWVVETKRRGTDGPWRVGRTRKDECSAKWAAASIWNFDGLDTRVVKYISAGEEPIEVRKYVPEKE